MRNEKDCCRVNIIVSESESENTDNDYNKGHQYRHGGSVGKGFLLVCGSLNG